MKEEKPIRVLLVDDEDSFRLPLAERLPKYLGGCKTVEVRNGEEAIQAVSERECAFDVALIDYALHPGKNGVEVMQEIQRRCPHVQTILFTGWGIEPEIGLEALRSGAYRYISKASFSVEELAITIRMAVEHQQLEQRAWLAKVLETSSALQSTLEMDEVLQKILHGVRDLGYDRVRLYLLSADRTTLSGKMQVGGPEDFESISLSVEEDEYSKQTLRSKTPRIYRKGELGPDLREIELDKRDLLEWIDIPLLVKGRPIGKMSIDNNLSCRPLAREELRPLMVFANQAALAIENARLVEELDFLNVFGRTLVSSLEQEQVLKTMLGHVAKVLNVEASSVLLLNETGDELVIEAAVGRLADKAEGLSVPMDKGISSWVVRENQPAMVLDVKEDSRFYDGVDEATDFATRSVIAAPLQARGRALGAIEALNKADGAFGEKDLELLESMALSAGIAIDNARLHETQASSLSKLRALYDTLRTLRATLDDQTVLETITDSLFGLFKLATCTIGLVDDTGEWLEFRVHRGLEESTRREIEALPSGLWKQLRDENEPVLVPDLAEHPDLAEQLVREDLKSFAALPLQGRESFLGILTMSSTERLELTEEDWDLVRGLADQAALAVEDARLYRLEQERARRWHKVAEAGKRVSHSLNQPPKDLLDIIAQGACEIVSADCAVIYVYDAATKSLDPDNYGRFGLRGAELSLSPKPRNPEGWAGQIIKKGRVVIEDLTTDRQAKKHAPKMRFFTVEGVRAFAGLRLCAADEPVGILYVSFRDRHNWTDDELEAIQPFVDQAALTIQHSLVQRKRYLALSGIVEAGQILTSTLELTDVLKQIVETAMYTLECDAITLHPYDQSKREFLRQYVHMGVKGSKELGWSDRDSEVAEGVIASGQPHFADESRADPILWSDFAEGEGFVSSAGLLLTVRDDPEGVMFVNYRSPHHFTDDEKDVVGMFARYAAIAIYNARLFDEIEKGRERMRAIHKVSQAFSSTLELDEVIDILLSGLVEPFPQADSRLVHLYRPDTHCLIPHPASYKYYWEGREDLEASLTLATEKAEPDGIAGWVARSRETINVPDVSSDKRYKKVIPRTRSQISVPIEFGDELISVLSLESQQREAFDEEDQQLLETLARTAGVAIENARRYERLEKTQETLKARTALAWLGMSGATWFHRVRGTAAVIKDWTLLIRKKLAETDHEQSVSDDLKAIDTEAEGLLDIPTRRLLPTEDETESIPINEFLRRAVEELRGSRRDVTVSYQLNAGDHVEVQANAVWLAIAVEALVKNSLRAMPDGGQLTVETSQATDRVQIRLADTGDGIPKTLQDKLFKRPLTEEDGAKGSGMGLLIAHTILEGYQGDIELESTGKRGTTFRISIPTTSEDRSPVRSGGTVCHNTSCG